MVLKGAFCGDPNMPKCVSDRGSAPGPAVGAHDAPRDTLSSGEGHPFHTSPHSALDSPAFGARHSALRYFGALPEIFFSRTVPGCMVAMASLSFFAKISSRFLPFRYCLTPPYMRKNVGTQKHRGNRPIVWDIANVLHDGAVGAPTPAVGMGLRMVNPALHWLQ